MHSAIKRPRHYNTPGHAHELSFSCTYGNRYFTDPVACRMVCEEIQRARQMHTFKLLAYALLPGSVHLVIWPQSVRYNMAVIVKEIKGITAARYQLFLRDNGLVKSMAGSGCMQQPFVFWQPHDCYDANLRHSQAIADAMVWVEAGPVRRGLVTAPHLWKWSSAYTRCANKGLVPDRFPGRSPLFSHHNRYGILSRYP